jgi:hypothetical protein
METKNVRTKSEVERGVKWVRGVKRESETSFLAPLVPLHDSRQPHVLCRGGVSRLETVEKASRCVCCEAVAS